jgi:hypothetical protein
MKEYIPLLYKQYVYNGDIQLEDNGNGIEIVKWDVDFDIPSDSEILTKYQEYVKDKQVLNVNNIAHSKILSIAPEHQQRNMTARGAELLQMVVEGETLTAAEQAERSAIKDIWDRIKAIRAHAKYLEEEILAGNNPNIEEGWPG